MSLLVSVFFVLTQSKSVTDSTDLPFKELLSPFLEVACNKKEMEC